MHNDWTNLTKAKLFEPKLVSFTHSVITSLKNYDGYEIVNKQ